MRDEIEENDIEYMADYTDPPWKHFGTEIPNDATSVDQILQTTKLDWTVEKVQNYYTWNNETFPNNQVLIRSDTGYKLTDISDDWKPVQNHALMNFILSFIKTTPMSLCMAGELKGGEIVWVLAKADAGFDVFDGDIVESYILFTNPHQYGKCFDIRFLPLRKVNNTTLTLSLQTRGELSVKINHRQKFDASLAFETATTINKKMKEYKLKAEFLGSKQFTKEQVEAYFMELFPAMSKKDPNGLSLSGKHAINLLEKQPGKEFAPGSWWQVFNAAVFLMDYHRARSKESLINSAWYGPRKSFKIKAYDLALSYAETV